jgi:hypothetical protein
MPYKDSPAFFTVVGGGGHQRDYQVPTQLRPFLFSSTPLDGCHLDYSIGELTTEQKGYSTGLAMASMLATVFVAAMIFSNKKLSQHPSNLIGYICICEALSSFNALVYTIHPMDFICYFGLHYVYTWTTFNK